MEMRKSKRPLAVAAMNFDHEPEIDDMSQQEKRKKISSAVIRPSRGKENSRSPETTEEEGDDEGTAETLHNGAHISSSSESLAFPSESGQISSIYVENFMCHHKMTVSLGSHVNFITGQNGSGEFAFVNFFNL